MVNCLIVNKMMKRIMMSLALAVAMLTGAKAQQLQIPDLPLDPAVKMGKLDNGLTYYIRHNEWPEQRANFYIAQKVGSMQEEDDQRGLAHFLEHMCFNGTTHFPGNALKTYLETIGVKFGENLNAYTSFDETVYNIDNVPVISNPQSIDSCLLILHDWSHDLLLEGKEIDKERGVIEEEWRMRSSAQQRILEKALPVLFEGSKYAHRMPIGTMEIVKNFPYEAIRKYYRKWYRPDLQAIVVVGDVDVDAIEAKIKTMFADIQPAAADAAKREYFTVAENKEPVFSVNSDKEQQRSLMNIVWKHEAFPREMKNSVLYYAQEYLFNAMEGMLSTRVAELLQKENPPFLGGGVSFNDDYLITNAMACSGFSVVFADNQHKKAIEAIYREMLRAERFGFTMSEYERYREEYKASIENMYERRDKISNGSFVSEYIRHFLDNVAAPGIEWEHKNLIQIADQVTVEAVNQALTQMVEERKGAAPVIFGMFPEKEGLTMPTKDEVLAILKAVEAEEIEAYKEEVSDEPILDDSKLKGGKIKKTEKAAFDFTKLTLSNGIEIFVRKTDFTPNSISMSAVSWGGTSLYGEKDWLDISNASRVDMGGWGNFSAIDMSKKLAGIKASVNPSIGTRSESMSGSCVVKDFETMLKLTYLAFTSPRKDEEVYKSTISRMRSQLENAELNPQTALSDTAQHVIYNDHYMARRTKPADLDKINYDHMIQLYKERFADANDFQFFFIGDIDIEKAKPLFEKYLGSLPTLSSKENYKVVDLKMAKGKKENIFTKEQETPNAIILIVHHAPMQENLKNILAVDMMEQALQMLFTETVREDEGGAYGVGVSAGLSDYPEKQAQLVIQLPTAPEKYKRMMEIIDKGLADMAANGPKEEDMQKIKEYMLRSHDESIKSNGYWMGAIQNLVRENKNYVDGYVDAVNNMTIKDVQQAAQTILNSGNRIVVGMTTPVE